MLYLVAAVSDNNVIGTQGRLPWHLKRELKWFKMNTHNGAVIMGRKTWDSLPRKPLPSRLNIIITRGALKEGDEHSIWTHSLSNAIKIAYAHTKRVYIIGGSEIFNLALQQYRCHLLITRVHCQVNPLNQSCILELPTKKKLLWRSETQTEKKMSYHFEFYTT